MKPKSKIQSLKTILLDPYCISTIFFVVWVVFFDYQNVFSQHTLYARLKKLEEDHIYYTSQIKQIKKEKKELLNNCDLLEKFAREKYYMKKEKEDLYIIVQD
ncbi:septum formation initiator family protein [Cardinium endosymbiont of Culicoides punctatus]|uniref:septum formation initiator family protein n=1 Tax=Cardinium endosymbiont of Culicoides punctatus TaxID=2304601 RepID=UPI0010E44FB5|nr:septum formation initiator family protein [Cardinium endosymbiont of Culicoides punctatus]TDG95332.1 hypothetical protein CCPUN_05240 [Cardinium endosymbiont of Culicoides punctatus]